MFDIAQSQITAAVPGAPADTAELAGELEATRRRIRQLEAQASRMLAQLDAGGSYVLDGYSSTTAYVKHRHAASHTTATQRVRRARALQRMPEALDAFESGLLSVEQVDLLVEGHQFSSEHFDVASWTELAIRTPLITKLRRAIEYWKNSVAPDLVEMDRDAIHGMRGVWTNRTLFGMVNVNAWLDEEDGDVVLRALDPGPPPPDDPRTQTQRRADRLVELCTSGGAERPQLVVHVDWQTLVGRGSSDGDNALAMLAETELGSVLTDPAIRRIACDSTVGRVVFGPRGEPLDVGRMRRTIPRALRRAVVARDGRCIFDGCDTPPHWCDVHHIVHWAEGGATEICNLVLLCRFHHRLVHERQWTVHRTSCGFELRPPDWASPPDPPPTPPDSATAEPPQPRSLLEIIRSLPRWEPPDPNRGPGPVRAGPN